MSNKSEQGGHNDDAETWESAPATFRSPLQTSLTTSVGTRRGPTLRPMPPNHRGMPCTRSVTEYKHYILWLFLDATHMNMCGPVMLNSKRLFGNMLKPYGLENGRPLVFYVSPRMHRPGQRLNLSFGNTTVAVQVPCPEHLPTANRACWSSRHCLLSKKWLCNIVGPDKRTAHKSRLVHRTPIIP